MSQIDLKVSSMNENATIISPVANRKNYLLLKRMIGMLLPSLKGLSHKYIE
jgi:hypothetical protein